MKKTDFVIYNGNKFRITDPVFGIENRAFKFGDGFFESVFSYFDEVPFWGYHYSRISNAMHDYDMPGKLIPSSTTLLNEILRLSRSNKFYGKVYTRISIFREDRSKYLPDKNTKISYFLEQKFLGQDKFTLNTEGLRLGKFTEYRKPINKWSKYKKINSDIFVFASIFADKQGFDDVFIINANGKIVETTNSNIFCLNEDGKVYTPSIESGCVSGIMRRVVIDLLKSEGIAVIETEGFDDTGFSNTEELFLTNAISGIKWVGAYKDKRFIKDISRKLVEKLNSLYLGNK